LIDFVAKVIFPDNCLVKAIDKIQDYKDEMNNELKKLHLIAESILKHEIESDKV